jgi:hypothetical protein
MKFATCMERFTKVLLAAVFLAPFAVAHAQTLGINYYTISSSDPDADNLSGGTFTNEVQNSLGSIDGLPILNTSTYGCSSGCISGVSLPTNLLSDGEITYWDPAANPYVTETLSSTITLPVNIPDDFFPPNGTGTQDGGSSGYQAAELYGTLVVPTTESVSFTIASDDMAFAYVGGSIVCDDGGVHGITPVGCSTDVLTPGDYSINLFFVDINQTQAGLEFALDTTGVTTTPPPTVTPEPGTITLLSTGLLGLAGFVRRKVAQCV